MRTFIVPMLQGETHAEYSERISNMVWQFVSARELLVGDGTVSVDGNQPAGASFGEILPAVIEKVL